MTSPISRTDDRTAECEAVPCHRVHAAGIEPNGMNRFVQPNTHEVLFVT